MSTQSDTRRIDEQSASRATAMSNNSSSSIPSLRNRLPPRSTTPSQSPQPSAFPRRRSSVLSFSSVEDLRQSFHDEIINPRTGRQPQSKEEDEVTHWHSTPLAFAILPAIGGLLFKNGSAFVTDILLLGLAAIFMNWSIRLPWDWYYSAQSIRQDVEPAAEADDRIVEETADELALETGSPAASPAVSPTRENVADPIQTQDTVKRQEAAADLRMQELMALAATFIFPMLAAYLLHVIRAQLSGPSTSLVSDYNLTIFILAAEVRPVRQVVRLVSNRTLYLQRTATGRDSPIFGNSATDRDVAEDLQSRLDALEARLLPASSETSLAQKTDVNDLSLELRKRYEPRLEGLERAVRRYEKRSTTMAIATEQRLQSLETRLQEALSLAAVAAQYSQNRTGIVSSTIEASGKLVTLPWKILWTISTWPFAIVEELYSRLKTLLLGPLPQRAAKKSRHNGKAEVNGIDARKEKLPPKRLVR